MTTKTAPSATTFEPQLDVALIHKHPHNPRHKAIADQELIDSVKAAGLIQPIVVAPHATRDGDYVLIAGHRRLDACKKNRYKTVPAMVRADLVSEAKQVEAMLIENGRRSDLTPIEEAEGYQQLALFPGYTQKRVAQTVGVDPKTVASRLKLLKLGKSTQNKVHAGQLAIDDALSLVSFADDPKLTKKLEAAVGTHNFRYELERAKTTKKVANECAKEISALKAAGGVEHQLPKDTNTWNYFRDPANPSKIDSFEGGMQHPDAHSGCLGYVHDGRDTQWQKVIPVCLDPASHGAQVDEEEQRRRAEIEQRHAEDAQRRADAAAAEKIRAESVLGLLDGKVLPKGIEKILRVALPVLVTLIETEQEQTRFFDLLNFPAEARWEPSAYRRKTADVDKIERYFQIIATHADNVLPRVFAAYLIAQLEQNLQHRYGYEHRALAALRYLEFLQDIGHPFCDVDRELYADLDNADDEAEAS